jgi:crotonobetainyl-CoA:carnitine CoA-transferase CaiB-like acyl-CoA transferase
MTPLDGFRILTLAVNRPGPLAAAQLRLLGAAVVKVEPPAGDLLARVCRAWYDRLREGQQVVTLDLKGEGRGPLDEWLAGCDLLLTATRPAALRRLGLDRDTVSARHPRVCQVAIVGEPAPRQDLPGHDLTYMARAGLLDPPHLPRTCLADLAGAERAVSAALALLLARERGQGAGYAEVSLADAADDFAAPWRYGLTSAAGVLGGAYPGYAVYRAREGWVALAALEPHFWDGLVRELGLTDPDRGRLQDTFLTRTAAEWEAWAEARGLPLARVRDAAP